MLCEPATCTAASLAIPTAQNNPNSSWPIVHTGRAMPVAPDTALRTAICKLLTVATEGGLIETLATELCQNKDTDPIVVS